MMQRPPVSANLDACPSSQVNLGLVTGLEIVRRHDIFMRCWCPTRDHRVKTPSGCKDQKPGSCPNNGERMDDGQQRVDVTVQAEAAGIQGKSW